MIPLAGEQTNLRRRPAKIFPRITFHYAITHPGIRNPIRNRLRNIHDSTDNEIRKITLGWEAAAIYTVDVTRTEVHGQLRLSKLTIIFLAGHTMLLDLRRSF